ncbi:MAG: hypothetical protein NVS9B10_26360 [Nevskia sp.]
MTTLLAVVTVICATQNSVERICLSRMAARFGVPQALLAAVREQEGGRVGGWNANADGSFDYGIMQINSRWLPQLELQGYSAKVLTYDACASIAAGAWILSNALADAGVWRKDAADPHAYWRAVGRYHSRTPSLNRAYAEGVWARYSRLKAAGSSPTSEGKHACAQAYEKRPALPASPFLPVVPASPAMTVQPRSPVQATLPAVPSAAAQGTSLENFH